MFDFFSQIRLKQKGFTSGKKRRKQRETEWSKALEQGSVARAGLFAAFVILVTILTVFFSHENAIFAGQKLKNFVVVLVISSTLMIQLYVNVPVSFNRNARLLLLLFGILVQLLLFRLSVYMVETFAPDAPAAFSFLAAPYAFAPMLLSLLVGRNHGTFAAVYAGLLGAVLVEASLAFQFVIFALICGFVAVYRTHTVRRRNRLVSAGAHVGAACVVVALSLGFIQWPAWGQNSAEWQMMLTQVVAAIAVSTFTAILVGGLLPGIEDLFRITTDISWIELADLNHPLLKRMTIEAPGTYHHSLVVANLAEAAAEVVGANAAMCRVCSYFHDIGKLNKPEYFIENIGEGENPHDELTPNMSALIVIAHVKDGVDLALKHKLNKEIIAVIKEHHGTSLIQYFYHRALTQREEFEKGVAEGRSREEDVPEVDKESFRYPGPTPRTRESAIVSLADAVESASRTLQKPTPAKIEQLIDGIASGRLNEGQLDYCSLTLKDLTAVKASFAITLRSMMHNRIAYPKLEGDSRPATEKKVIENGKKATSPSATQKLKRKVPPGRPAGTA